jgi:hypothetical protein
VRIWLYEAGNHASISAGGVQASRNKVGVAAKGGDAARTCENDDDHTNFQPIKKLDLVERPYATNAGSGMVFANHDFSPAVHFFESSHCLR